MKVTSFESLYVTHGYLEEIATVEELIASPRAVSVKEQARLFSPTEFVANRRDSEHALRVHFGVLDFDHLAIDARDLIVAHLSAQGYEFAFYTTHRHDPSTGTYRFRIAVPFVEPVAAADWAAAWPEMVERLCPSTLGVQVDAACKDVARWYFEPSFHPSREEHAEAFFIAGRPLDLRACAGRSALPLPPKPGPGAEPGGPTHKYTVDDLRALERRLRRRQSACAISAAECAKHVVKGDAWGTIDNRNERLSNLCFELIQEWEGCNPEQIGELFSSSCALMQQQSDGQKYTPSFVANMLREKVKYVAQRRRQYEQENHDAYVAELEVHGLRIYTPEEMVDRRRREVHPHGWVLQTDNGAYVATQKSGYVYFRGVNAAKNAAHLNLLPARPYGIRTTRYDKDGVQRVLPLDEMVQHFGTVPDRVAGSLVVQETRWSSETRTLTIAECPVRPLQPHFSKTIDGWLRLLGGDKYELLMRWMAWVTYLSHSCTMLVMAGPTGCGKSLFARGLARLWTLGEPTSLADALDSFNAPLARCPLLFADEKVPRGRDGRHRFDDMRELISKKYFSVNEKNQPKRDVEGAVRIIVAINDLSLLVGETPESSDELKATLERILHITPSSETPAYLDQLRKDGVHWTDDAIAEHALALRAMYPLPVNPPRFLFEPQEQVSLANAFVSSSAMFGAICTWLISFLREPRKLYAEVTSLHDMAWRVRATRNGLFATPAAIQHHWGKYEDRRPYHSAVRHAFLGLNVRRTSIPTPLGPAHTQLVNFERLAAFAEENALAERDELLRLIDEYVEQNVYGISEDAARQRIKMRDDATNVVHFRKKG